MGASKLCCSTAATDRSLGSCSAALAGASCLTCHGLPPPDETQLRSSVDAVRIIRWRNIEALRIMVLFSVEITIKMSVMSIDDIEKTPQMLEGKSLQSGLYIVATPIGNLRDISLRALDILRSVDIIMCEDTRVTRKLLGAYQIKAKMHSYNDHSDAGRRRSIISQIEEGKAIALVSDAGMPLISDPGYKLVRDCDAAGLYITTIPGASAPLAALQISGLPSDKFCFLGFMPHKTKARQKIWQQWKSAPATLLAFEAAPRLIASLRDVGEVLGGREVAVVREITKLYEEVRKGSPDELVSYYEEHGLPRGEIVLVIAPPEEEVVSEEAVEDMIRDALDSMKTKEAAAFVADKTGLKKNDLYNIALKIVKED